MTCAVGWPDVVSCTCRAIWILGYETQCPAAPVWHVTPGSGLHGPISSASSWPGQGLSVAKVVGDEERVLLICPFGL